MSKKTTKKEMATKLVKEAATKYVESTVASHKAYGEYCEDTLLSQLEKEIDRAIRVNEDKVSRNPDIGDPQGFIRAEANGSILGLKWVSHLIKQFREKV